MVILAQDSCPTQRAYRVSVFGPIPSTWVEGCEIVPRDANPDLLFYANDGCPVSDEGPIIVGVTGRSLEMQCDVTFPINATPEHVWNSLERPIARLRAHQKTKDSLGRVKEKLSNLQADFEAIDADLAIAKSLQDNLLQDKFVDLPNTELSFFLKEKLAIGGDHVGHFTINDTWHGFYAFDVAGHGISSALLIARLVGMFHGSTPETNVAVEITTDGKRPRLPAKVLSHLNTLLCEVLETDHFVTAVIGYVNHKTGEVLFGQAGHPHPAVMRTNGLELQGSGGLPIGLIPMAEYTNNHLTLEPGDSFWLFSDGILDASDETGLGSDAAQLLTSLATSRDASGHSVFETAIEYLDPASIQDDLSGLMIRYGS